MKQYLEHDEWCIIESGFHRDHSRVSESIFSLGNGRFGQRANFEERFSGDTLSGNYIAGIYYPDKTRVGWWKNGYPEYYAKVLNAPNWIGIDVEIDGEVLDLHTCELTSFQRVLNMQEGYLERKFVARLVSGRKVEVNAKRFCSIDNDEIGTVRYSIKALDFSGAFNITPYIDADVVNEDANYDEKFWIGVSSTAKRRQAYVTAKTKKTAFEVCTGMKFDVLINGEAAEFNSYRIERDLYAGCTVDLHLNEGDELVIYKYAAVVTSLNHQPEQLQERCKGQVKTAFKQGFDRLLAAQRIAWERKWAEADIQIEGDIAAQQGIRFNIFQLYQTYTGEDERLNIGPKGFTGERYGGATYWDTEAYCFPFYLSTADPHVARNLLLYRYKHLPKAIENAEKLGFKDGAALYPMVTMNGEECHNEWEITFEEIHRNAAIAYAIYDYIRYTGDRNYLIDYGLEVLIGIARFWAQRVHFSEWRNQYVMHGVTGPNEYENNVNNNWYTNYAALWCLQYTIDSVAEVEQRAPEKYKALEERIKFYRYTETKHWKSIIDQLYLPADEAAGIFLQQDLYLDKELLVVDDLKPEDRPLNQKWSWDRILRSCFIKQADVLQGMYFFEDHFDRETIRRNFEFYEPRTVHESSLSPCVHAVLAASLNKREKSYEMYLRTARLDLNDYNNDTCDGLHITSMAGTWMAVVKGFGGLRVYDDVIQFNPFMPKEWKRFTFKVRFRGHFLEISVGQTYLTVKNGADKGLNIKVYQQTYELPAGTDLEIPINSVNPTV